jgi:hypothetical protein
MRDSMQQAASEVQSAVDTELSKTADDLNKSLEPEKAKQEQPKEEHKAG